VAACRLVLLPFPIRFGELRIVRLKQGLHFVVRHRGYRKHPTDSELDDVTARGSRHAPQSRTQREIVGAPRGLERPDEPQTLRSYRRGRRRFARLENVKTISDFVLSIFVINVRLVPGVQSRLGRKRLLERERERRRTVPFEPGETLLRLVD